VLNDVIFGVKSAVEGTLVIIFKIISVVTEVPGVVVKESVLDVNLYNLAIYKDKGEDRNHPDP
jgi:hypothetical protein